MQAIKLINNMINEELSINKQVHEISLDIFQQILSNKTNKTNFETILGKIKTINFSFNINGIKVTCYEYHFNNRKDYEEIEVPNNIVSDGKSIIFHGNKWITLNLIYISGTLVKTELLDTIMHEVNHIFQQERSELNFQDRKDNDFYRFVLTNLTNEDFKIRQLSLIEYFTFDYEIDGFINGMFGQLDMEQPKTFELINKTVKESKLYEYLNEIIKVSEELNNNRHYLDSAIEYYRNNGFNTTTGRILKNIEYVINRITAKLGKIIIKYKQDYLKEARFTNPFNINFLLF